MKVLSIKALNEKPFMPHTKSMKLIEEVVELDLELVKGVFAMKIRKEKPYYNDSGYFESVWLIEILAQAAAGLFHFQCGRKGDPAIGFLVGLDNLDILSEAPIVEGDKLMVDVKLEGEFYPFGVYACEAYIGTRPMARGNLKFLADENGEMVDRLMGRGSNS